MTCGLQVGMCSTPPVLSHTFRPPSGLAPAPSGPHGAVGTRGQVPTGGLVCQDLGSGVPTFAASMRAEPQ
eukprot:15368219-Alexandrium_andersonii.AAC.1